MTPSEADELVDRLIAAFPRRDWSDQTIALYSATLERLPLEHGGHAVNRAVATLDLAPTVRWLLDTAHAESARTAAPIAPDLPDPEPPEVHDRVKQLIADARAKLRGADRAAP